MPSRRVCKLKILGIFYLWAIILRELYPQATITLSAYEHITESEGAEAAIEAFRKYNNLSGEH